tara:strand:+ start:707 stop:2884 length:2178 start_codon:yes stop_codon:yes gene_type:complete
MKYKYIQFFVFSMLFVIQVSAKDYYVSTKGNDSNNGTLDKPFKTISKAASRMKAGDVCFIREGVYHETVKMRETNGSSSKRITFKSYNNEYVLLDGSISLDLNWEKHEGNIYKAKLKTPVWQLFVDDVSMTSARWPNGNWNDGSVWDKKKSMAWPEKKKGTYGHHFNKELTAINGDLTGAIIIVNSGSFKTFKSNVIEHTPGADNFKYDTKRKSIKVHFSFKGKIHRHGYFLEGKLALLDEENEWFYNPKSKEIYLWTPEGKHPKNFKIKGKTKSYAFDIANSSYVKLEGLNFFGTTFKANESHHMTVEDCNFMYPSYSKRMLGDLSLTDVSSMQTKKKYTKTHNAIRNCKFEYMDGPVLDMNGWNNVVENNYMHNIDYSCTYKGGYTLNMSQATQLLFRRNTVHTSGASEMYKAGVRNTIELNDLSKSGHLQNDGSLVQVSVASQDKSQTRFNWVHNSVKQGLRFDNKNTPNAPWGENGNMHHNVAWKTERIYFKGDKHFIYNNVSFDSRLNDLIISSNAVIQGHNHTTITRNNISNKFSGNRTKPGKKYPVPGVVDHNWAGDVKEADVRSQLRDPDNLDFRPKKDSELVDAGALIKGKDIQFIGNAPDIGAYEYGDTNYWIPGFQDKKASVAIPKNKTITAKENADLMWLMAYKALANEVYFGTNYSHVEKATRESSQYKGTQKNNIYTPGTLESGKTYFWRIDSVMNETTVKGEVFEFTVEQ